MGTTTETEPHVHDWKLDVGTRYRCVTCQVYGYAKVTNYVSGHGASFDRGNIVPYKCNALRGMAAKVGTPARPELCSEDVVELRGSLKLCDKHSKAITPSKDPEDVEYRAALNREERRVEQRNADAFRRLSEQTAAAIAGPIKS